MLSLAKKIVIVKKFVIMKKVSTATKLIITKKLVLIKKAKIIKKSDLNINAKVFVSKQELENNILFNKLEREFVEKNKWLFE